MAPTMDATHCLLCEKRLSGCVCLRVPDDHILARANAALLEWHIAERVKAASDFPGPDHKPTPRPPLGRIRQAKVE